MTAGLVPSVRLSPGFQWRRLSQLAAMGTGHTPDRSKPEYWQDCDVPWVTAADLSQRSNPFHPLMDTEQKISRIGLANSAAVLHPAGTVMLCRTASVGLVCLTGVPMATTQAFVTWTPGPDLNPRFLMYSLHAMAPEWDRLAYGSTHRTIYMPDLESVRIPHCAFRTQTAIADFLDAETARIDALIRKKRRMVALLEERERAAIFRRATGTDCESEQRKPSSIPWLASIPSHWSEPSIGMNFDVQLGKMLHADASSGTDLYPYLRNENVQWDQFDLDDLKVMGFDASERARFDVRDGDLFVCEGGEAGRSAVWAHGPAELFFQKALLRVRPHAEGNTRFLMYGIWAAASQGVFQNEGNQSTFVHLTQEKLRAHRLPWPPPLEQHKIVSALDALRARSASALTALRLQVDLLHERRQAVIAAAVTGDMGLVGDRR